MCALAVVVIALACFPSCRQSVANEDGASGRYLLDSVKLGDSMTAIALLAEGVYTEVRDENGDTPMLYAVRTGNIHLTKVILRHDVVKDARSGNGRGALELALDSGNREMMECLLEGGVSPDEIGYDNNPLLLKAVRFGDVDTVKLLIKHGVSPSATGKDGQTALHVAARDGLEEFLDLLLVSGVDPDVEDDEGYTPLWTAANISRPVERSRTMMKLIDSGADVDSLGPGKETLLSQAIKRGLYKEAVKFINHGADVNGVDGGAPAPIDIALATGREDLVALLLSRGVDGVALLSDAFQHGEVERVRLLFQAGVPLAGLGAEDESGEDGVIAKCVRMCRVDLAELCLQYGANPTTLGKEGQSPLHMAVATGDAPMVELLLEYGADPNKYFKRPVSRSFIELAKSDSMKWFLKNERRVTPLMMATNNGDLSIISSLLDHGAKKYVYTGRHRLYPVNFASRRGDVKAMQVILGQDPEKELYHAVLDLSDQRVTLYNSNKEVVFSSRVSTGKAGYRTPKGTYVITDKHTKHTSTIYGASMPYFQRLSCSAFGFHSGNCPGYPASHGCIRMPYNAARKFFGITPVGTRVIIRP